jgi:choline dehydrogenase-like flavoprotein
MQLDARTLPDRATLDAELCIVGAGPAGLALAADLVDSPARIIVVESGSWETEPAAQLLNLVRVEGDPHAGLQVSRCRQIGGTSRTWNMPLAPSHGAKFVPLDALDFRGELGRPPWPLRFADLEPNYIRAQAVAGLGQFEYEASAWKLPASPIAVDHPTLVSRIYQFGPSSRFCEHLPNVLARAANVTLCHSATVVRLRWRRSAVEALEAITANGTRLTVNTRRLVLAGGGIENARLLLVEAEAGNFQDESGWLGRGFMEHPRDFSIRLDSSSRRLFDRLEFFDAHAVEGATVGGRIALREEAILGEDLPNASMTLLPAGRSWRPFHWRIESLAWRRLGWNLQWPPGYGWSRLRPFARRFDGFQLLINLEEFPNPDNRLGLDAERDPLGVRRVRLRRRWRRADAERLIRLRAVVARGLEDMGLGPLAIGALVPPDPNSHHHLGTTRMGPDPKTGVTDSHGQVFGTDNLFVVGGSLFPAAGYANPTLTAIALALRLADRFRMGLSAGQAAWTRP